MYKILFTLMAVLALCSCEPSADEQASRLLSDIERLNTEGKYSQALDSIMKLRAQFPQAIKARQRALEIWQEASKKMAQQDLIHTDSLLQATIAQQQSASTRLERNMLGVKVDSLKARVDALSGVVRIIRHKQSEDGVKSKQ